MKLSFRCIVAFVFGTLIAFGTAVTTPHPDDAGRGQPTGGKNGVLPFGSAQTATGATVRTPLPARTVRSHMPLPRGVAIEKFTAPRTASTNVLDSKGTEFWLLFERNYDGAVDALYFDITGDVPTSGTIEIPGMSFSTPFSVTPGTITRVVFPNDAQLFVEDGIENKGIHVTANDEVAIYGVNLKQYTTDGYLALPVDILSTQYLVMSYPSPWSNIEANNRSQFAVVSPYDNVILTITPSEATVGGHPAGVPYEVILNRGECYQAQCAETDFTGTVIQSSLPVAVFGGNACTDIPSQYVACDHLIDQLPPMTTWGKDFLAVPLKGRLHGDTWRILASQDSTSVFINGSFVTMLNFADYYETILDAPASIVTSKPALTMQFANGDAFDSEIENNGDPFMMMIPPTEQFMNHYTFSTPSQGYTINEVNVVIAADKASTLVLDGQSVDPSAFVSIPNTQMAGGGIDIAVGSHTITSTAGAPFGIYCYGFNSYDSYGYAGGLSLQIISTNTAPVIRRTAATIALSNASQFPAEDLTIEATITDTVEPLVQSATLYYRLIGAAQFSSVAMSLDSGNLWSAVIPGSAVDAPGMQYYLSTTDGQLTALDPSIDPQNNPYVIAVLPNVLPAIQHTPVTSGTATRDIAIRAGIVDNTQYVASATLYYRMPGGNPVYAAVAMTNSGGTNYTATISGSQVTVNGVEYYLGATDNYGATSFHGTADNPHVIAVRDTGGNQGLGQTIFTGYAALDNVYAPAGTVIRCYNHRTGDLVDTGLVVPFNEGKNYALSILSGDGGVLAGDALDFTLVDALGAPVGPRSCIQPAIAVFDSAFPPSIKEFNILSAHRRSFTMSVVPGYNALSWNVKPDNDSVAAVFGRLINKWKVQLILEYQGCANPPSFNYYVPELGIYNPMQITDYRKGYFVKLLPGVQPDTFSVTGMPVCNYEPIPVCGGYSFVSYLPERSAAVDQALASLDWSQLNFVLKYFNPGTGEADERFQYYPAEFQQMAEGNGYFVNMTGQLGTVVDTIVYPGLFEPVSAILSGAGQKPGKGTSAAGPLRTLSSGSRLLPQIMIAYGLQVRMNGALVASGAELVAVDRNNVVCGRGRFVADGVVSLAIRADDPSTAQDEGAERGEAVSLYLNGTLMPETVRWTEFGATVQLTDLAMGAGQQEQEKPHTFRLYQNYPNPFNPMTEISYDVAEQAYVQVRVYNTLGSEVATLVERMQPAGRYTVRWDGRDGQGRPAASGVYVCKLFAGDAAAKTVNRILTMKMMLVK